MKKFGENIHYNVTNCTIFQKKFGVRISPNQFLASVQLCYYLYIYKSFIDRLEVHINTIANKMYARRTRSFFP